MEPKSPAHSFHFPLPPTFVFWRRETLIRSHGDVRSTSWSLLHSPALPSVQLEAWDQTLALRGNTFLCELGEGRVERGWSQEQCRTHHQVCLENHRKSWTCQATSGHQGVLAGLRAPWPHLRAVGEVAGQARGAGGRRRRRRRRKQGPQDLIPSLEGNQSSSIQREAFSYFLLMP